MTSAMWLERELGRLATLEAALKNSQPVAPEGVGVSFPDQQLWTPPPATPRPTANMAQELKNAQQSNKKSNKCCIIA